MSTSMQGVNRSSKQSQGANHGVKKRKVRKGTHSCWECRRRKTRCHFDAHNEICDGCKARGTACTSQEFDDDRVPLTHGHRIVQRLNRLESLMEKLVEHVQPRGYPGAPDLAMADGSGSSSASESPRASISGESRLASGTYTCSIDSPSLMGVADEGSMALPSTRSGSPLIPTAKHASRDLDRVTAALLDIYPTQGDVEIIMGTSMVNTMVTSTLYPMHEVLAGKPETVNEVIATPLPGRHPVVLAKRLLQFALCLQHTLPSFDHTRLDANTPVIQLSNEYITIVSTLVCPDDELIASAEGLEVLLLTTYGHVNSRNLRKAWLVTRRALSLGQILGADKPSTVHTVPFHDSNSNPSRRSNPAHLWYRINYMERYLSLLLGLSSASPDQSYIPPTPEARLTPAEKLEAIQGCVIGRIIERNKSCASEESYAVTMSIDRTLEDARKQMEPSWWASLESDFRKILVTNAPSSLESVQLWLNYVNQVQHYTLSLLLHLPYLMRDPSDARWDYSRKACRTSSRAILGRYIQFRSIPRDYIACRHLDYSCLIASITLILSYLGRAPYLGGEDQMKSRETDKALLRAAQEKMTELAILSRDRVSREAAQIVEQLMSVIETGDASDSSQDALERGVKFDIPYLGIVNIINPGVTGARHGQELGVASNVGHSSFQTTSREASAKVTSDGPAVFLTLGPGLMESNGASLGMESSSISSMQMMANGELELNSLAGFDSGMDSYESTHSVSQPGLMAGSDEWLFQGLETTYWSLLHGGFPPNNILEGPGN
ncbi:hypothetical protein jhhlp_006048 [Lomentospora prolificans]|uniref:Zn(2)-C6 fungal-type domain-containing protein n=1 Tax=Lomentospora prolificans TaxID=41688 RepID=A0A2N3N4V0_9PEZI|nr:hypothetical protein jhhlp_006048 [Lomentospora prolificans]